MMLSLAFPSSLFALHKLSFVLVTHSTCSTAMVLSLLCARPLRKQIRWYIRQSYTHSNTKTTDISTTAPILLLTTGNPTSRSVSMTAEITRCVHRSYKLGQRSPAWTEPFSTCTPGSYISYMNRFRLREITKLTCPDRGRRK